MKGKLIFTHGTMEAGKSAELIQKAYQFDRKGFKVVVLKAASDVRSPEGKIKSRIGLDWDCLLLAHGASVEQTIVSGIQGQRADVILVDEAQFIDKDQVDELAFLADTRGTFVMAYGLRVDFNGELFPATKRFMEVADRIDEMPSICECGAKATHHVKLGGSDNQVSCGAAEKYKSVCRRCFRRYKEQGLCK